MRRRRGSLRCSQVQAVNRDYRVKAEGIRGEERSYSSRDFRVNLVIPGAQFTYALARSDGIHVDCYTNLMFAEYAVLVRSHLGFLSSLLEQQTVKGYIDKR